MSHHIAARGTSRDSATEEIPLPSWEDGWILEAEGPGGSARCRVRPGQQLQVGSGLSVDLRLCDSAVSALHCRVECGPSGFRIVDLGSRNGIMLGGARVRVAQLSEKEGAFILGRTTVVVRSANESPVPEQGLIPGLVGGSEPMRRLVDQIERLAPLRAPVLVIGESGVGKDVVARALHTLSGRTGNYYPLNVGTIPENLADSELFGHRRGAFTGAVASRMGAFELAHRGTLFLDEIGELPLSLQVKLLRVLEEGSVRPVGGGEKQSVDVRIVSATWAPLQERVGQGRFRFDLLQRLTTVVIDVPPLRHRKSDLAALGTMWLKRFENELGRRLLSERALARLEEHEWPGNVRELGNVLYRAGVLTRSVVLDRLDIELALAQTLTGAVGGGSSDVEEALRRAGGNVSEAARLSGLPRTTFRHRLASLRGRVSQEAS